MGKPIDFEYIQKMMDDNPDDWWSEEEAAARFDAICKKALNVTGPKVTVVDCSDGRDAAFRIDIDFDTIEERGRAKTEV
jgi:hypothetical protein